MERMSLEKWYWSFLLLYKNYRKLSSFKKKQNPLIYYFTVFPDQKWNHSWMVLCSVSHNANIKVLAKLCFYWMFEIFFLSPSGWQNSVPCSCMYEVPLHCQLSPRRHYRLLEVTTTLCHIVPPTLKSAKENPSCWIPLELCVPLSPKKSLVSFMFSPT